MGPYSNHNHGLKTPLARSRGLGSAKDGTHHFIVQRVSALALVPLCIWFVYSLVCQIAAPPAEFIAWAGSLVPATLLLLLIIFGFWHAALGLQVVVEDYVHREGLKLFMLIAVKLGCFAFAALGVLSVLKLAL